MKGTNMNIVVAILGFIGAGLVGFSFGRRQDVKPASADSTFFTTTPGGADGFCRARVLNRMKGRSFNWLRHGACVPAGTGYFEIRVKSGDSPLLPPRPRGVDHIRADVASWARPGDVVFYSLWQVLDDGQEKELHDPELEIGQI
jgi:hypothetical protein